MDDLQAMRKLRDYVPEPSKDELDEQWRYIAAETVDAAPEVKATLWPKTAADLDSGGRCDADRGGRVPHAAWRVRYGCA